MRKKTLGVGFSIQINSTTRAISVNTNMASYFYKRPMKLTAHLV